MMKHHRIFAILLAFALVTVLFAGCGSKPASDQTNRVAASEDAAADASVAESSDEPTAVEATAGAEPAAGSEPEDAESALETALEESDDAASMELPLCDEKTDLSMLMGWSPQNAGGMIDTLEEIKGIPAAEELTNVHVDFTTISSDSYNEIFALTVSGGDIPDMLSQAARSYPGGLLPGINDGILANIYPYIQECAPDYWRALNISEANVKQATLAEDTMGAMYMLREVGDATTGLIIRQDWLDALGMDMPVTYDDFEAVLTAFKNEYSCSSPYLLHSGLQTATFFTGGFGTSGFTTGTNTQQYMQSFYQVDGEVHCSLTEDGFKQYVELMHNWYDKGLIGLDFLSLASVPFTPDYMNLWQTSQGGLWHGRADSIDSAASQIVDSGAVVAPVAAAVEHPGDTYHFVDTHYISLNTSMAFNAESDNLELAIKWMNFWFTEPGAMIFCYGVEGDTYNIDDNGNIQLSEVCTENEMGMPAALILNFLTVEGKWPGLQYASLENYGTGELAVEAIEAWSKGDDSYIIPSMDVLPEYLNEYTAIFSDISTYAMESISAFIVGNKDMREWDSFVSDLDSLGLERCTEIMQETYNDFNK